MKKLNSFLKVKLCYRTYWKQWVVFIIFLLVIILVSEYANYTTKRVLEYEREKVVQRLEVAKEKDSLENVNNQTNIRFEKANTITIYSTSLV